MGRWKHDKEGLEACHQEENDRRGIWIWCLEESLEERKKASPASMLENNTALHGSMAPHGVLFIFVYCSLCRYSAAVHRTAVRKCPSAGSGQGDSELESSLLPLLELAGCGGEEGAGHIVWIHMSKRRESNHVASSDSSPPPGREPQASCRAAEATLTDGSRLTQETSESGRHLCCSGWAVLAKPCYSILPCN